MLRTQDLAFFEAHGYLVVPDVLPAQLLQNLHKEYSDLIDNLYAGWYKDGLLDIAPDALNFEQKLRNAYANGCDWFQYLDISLPAGDIMPDTPMHFGPAVFDLVTCSGLLDIVEQLIGPEIASNPIQHVRIKPPVGELHGSEQRAHITHTDWHQDKGVIHESADSTTMVTAWCAISDATLDNGCLQVIPNGNARELLPHCARTQVGISESRIDNEKAQPLPVPAGGVIFFHPLTAHGSQTNRSDHMRWSFDLRYHVTGQDSGRSHFPEFVARSKSGPVLRDWRAWRGMWEDTRTTLARDGAIDLYRWPHDGPYCA